MLGAPIKPTVAVIPGQQIELTVNNFTLLMKCLLYDMTNLTFKWEKKNSKLPSTAQGVSSDQLTITKLSPKDSGEYRCIVNNSTGIISSNYSLVTIKGLYVLNSCTYVHMVCHTIAQVSIIIACFYNTKGAGGLPDACT